MIAEVLHSLKLTPDEPVAALESRSGAGLHPVRTAAGEPAFLKVTPAALGADARAAAGRELRFYTEIAPAVPIRVPRLLDVAETSEGVALLLEKTGKTVDVRSWTPPLWTALGRDLAALHEVAVPSGWFRPDGLAESLDAPDLSVAQRFWEPSLARVTDLIAGRDALVKAMEAVPAVFVHGDCHTENIVVDGDTLVLLDWQVCGPGRPSGDLAFPNVRAMPAGVTAPAELLDSYLRHRPDDRATLELAILAEELSMYVFQWPPFAAYNTPSGVQRVRRRATELAARWFAETSA
ncbi:hypothetical protein Acy02nite_88910 [Actinoplanes cyaneus]|uniref:Aminoglycoside phosphotransferase domain-containing protein n=1 Tax=Actinoplanes cyaneus TaxID=52696 RepID=A0A919IRQ6_9ACTN|nr:aminoglycoside phosphotransferase family protein [Actinoplanes cyaneus]MCW2144277.1 Phosphotransferase enzyme family protein [Actinoplanes cyaneus]GID71010.1 hypothetical protein Acy02nite_88910 [Actinoplanes cyaneus]